MTPFCILHVIKKNYMPFSSLAAAAVALDRGIYVVHLCLYQKEIEKMEWEKHTRAESWCEWNEKRTENNARFAASTREKKRVHNQVVAARLPNDYTVRFPKCLAEVWIERNDRTTESQCRDIHKSHSRLNSPAQTFYKTDTSSVSCFLINVCNARVPHSNAAATAAA